MKRSLRARLTCEISTQVWSPSDNAVGHWTGRYLDHREGSSWKRLAFRVLNSTARLSRTTYQNRVNKNPPSNHSGGGGLSADNAGLPVCLTFMRWISLFSPRSELGTTLPLLRGMKGQHLWGFLWYFYEIFVYWLMYTKMMLWSKQYSNALDEEWVINKYGGISMYWCNIYLLWSADESQLLFMAEVVPQPSSTSTSSWKINNCCVNDV